MVRYMREGSTLRSVKRAHRLSIFLNLWWIWTCWKKSNPDPNFVTARYELEIQVRNSKDFRFKRIKKKKENALKIRCPDVIYRNFIRINGKKEEKRRNSCIQASLNLYVLLFLYWKKKREKKSSYKNGWYKMYKNFMECLVFSFLIVIYRDLDANTFFLTKIVRYIRIKLTRAIIPVTIEISNKYFVWKYRSRFVHHI